MSPPTILGIGASHNGAVCVLRGPELVVAIQEERLTRQKRARLYGAKPGLAIPYSLEASGISPREVARVAIAVQGDAAAPQQQPTANPDLAGYIGPPPLCVSHHRAHAVSAFVMSGFDEAAVMVIDGVGSPWRDLDDAERAACGEPDPAGWETLSLFHATRDGLVPLAKHVAPDGGWLQRRANLMPRFRSLGGMYSAVAVHTFGDAMEAGKVMGLAPYGKPTIPVEDFLQLDGIALRFSDAVPDRYELGRAWPRDERRHRDLAASVQRALEVALLELAVQLRARTGCKNLCFAGGVALNSVGNERLLRETGFERVYIPAAAEDSGTAIGAAYEALRAETGSYAQFPVRHDAMGRNYGADLIDDAVRRTPGIVELDVRGDVIAAAAARLARGELAGWFRGRSELGPRSLGQRSILADPRRADGKEILNARVKHREAFRPFAPAILEEYASEWFDLGGVLESPFMLRVAPFRDEVKDRVPAVVHVDGTGRLQTISRHEASDLHRLVSEFHALTQIPMLLNTSFNVMGEPIVETPEDALWCFLATGLDFCVIGDRLFTKAPWYQSPLDLVPALTAKRCTVELAIVNGTLVLEPSETADVELTVTTRWAEHAVRVPAELLLVMQHIDGRRTGHSIARALATADVSTERVLAAICSLRRSRIIDLHADARRSG